MQGDLVPAQNLPKKTRNHSAWGMFMGFVTAALGLFPIVYSWAAATITTVLLGWTLIFVGIAQFVSALQSQTPEKFLLKILRSVLYGICGIALAFFPIEGAAMLTGVLGTLLLVQAVLLTASAFQRKTLEGWIWFLAAADANWLLGMLILTRWPSSSVWAIGTLLGISVLMDGICRIVIAMKMRGSASNVHPSTQRSAQV